MNKEQKFVKVRGIVRFSLCFAKREEDERHRRDLFMFCRGLVSMAYDLRYIDRPNRALLLSYIDEQEKIANETN